MLKTAQEFHPILRKLSKSDNSTSSIFRITEDHYAHRYKPTLPYPDLPANQFCTLAQSFHLQLAYFAKLIYKTSLVVSDIRFSSISKQCFYFEWCNYYQIYQLAIYSKT